MIVNFVLKNRFYDSVFLMQIATKVKALTGVARVSVLMGTDSNKSLMKETSLIAEEAASAGPNDIVIAVEAESRDDADKAALHVEKLLEVQEVNRVGVASQNPRSVAGALQSLQEANVALISLPGPFVAYEAHKFLDANLHVMIFSDNVPLADEVVLKQKAGERGLLVMGPDCGTTILKGKALGFANVVREGKVGIIGASGTGIQQVSSLLSTYGIGISHAIGTGSKDLSAQVGGITMLTAMALLKYDPCTEVVLLISKPPNKKVAAAIIEEAKKYSKPIIINFLNADPHLFEESGITSATTLEEAVNRTIALVNNQPYVHHLFDEDMSRIMQKAEEYWKTLASGQLYIRGLYSGGTLCEEALVVLNTLIGGVHSNTTAYPELVMKNARKSSGNCMVDLGDDEFTRGTPHPMIDFSLRKDRILEEAKDNSVAVILLDIVLGYGSHSDPSAELVPVILSIRERRTQKPVIFIASLIGTDEDPQNLSVQKRNFESAGVAVLPSNAQAARFAALVATRGSVAEKFSADALK